MAISVTKPTVGGSEDTWGTTINTGLDTIVDALNGTAGTVAPDLSTLTIGGTDITATAAEINVLGGVTATTAEINYIDGVTSGVQTQLNAKIEITDVITDVTAGSGIAGGGSSGSVTISHADTSSQDSVDNSGSTYIQDITLDTYGHITGINSASSPIQITSGSAPYYSARAFVYIADGSNAANTYSGQNIASVVRNSEGDYTITFTTAMPDANYAISTGPNSQGSPNGSYAMAVGFMAKTASSFRVKTRRPNDRDVFDCDQLSFVVFA